MERLTIDEVIAHCKRNTQRWERAEKDRVCLGGKPRNFETDDMSNNFMKEYWEHRQVAEWLEQLKEYKNAEEQGLRLRLPCKEVYTSSGDTVYYIFDYEIVECINCGVSLDCEGKLWIALACNEHIFPYRNPDPEHDLDPTDWCINSTQVTIDKWGKTLFATKEEAEQALKRMEGE